MRQRLSIAIIGAGPAGLYAAGQLLDQHDIAVNVDVIDRLPTPYGLVRAGVAPDHPEKKLVIDRLFDYYLDHPDVRFFGNVELGTDITHDELKARYDAVIYAVGASSDVSLGIPGEAKAGSHAARDFVGWYNGHPDFIDQQFDFSTSRAVIIGNGNVALDIARILTLSPERLKQTEIADHAIEALANSAIEEVIILGRRGMVHAAFNNPEMEEFEHLENVDVLIENAQFDKIPDGLDWNTLRKIKLLKRYSEMPRHAGRKRIVFRFLTSPVEILGDSSVTGLKTVSQTGADKIESTIDTGLVLRSVGYRGAALPGLPFDDTRKIIPNERGRVLNGDSVQPGTYVTGWIKRGPRGVIGTNKKCARETVRCLLEDAKAGHLGQDDVDYQDIEILLRQRKPDYVSATGWKRIDKFERTKGSDQGRPRVKITSWDELLEVAGR